MSMRNAVYAVTALVLVALNLWYWQPVAWLESGPAEPGGRAAVPAFRPEEFRVRLSGAEGEPVARGVVRDPFRPAQPPRPKRTADAARSRPTPKAVAETKAAQQAVAAQRETAKRKAAQRSQSLKALGSFKLAGVLVRPEGRQAFLTQADAAYIVRPGDTIAQRYRVDDISLNSVRLTDTETQVTNFIPLSGD